MGKGAALGVDIDGADAADIGIRGRHRGCSWDGGQRDGLVAGNGANIRPAVIDVQAVAGPDLAGPGAVRIMWDGKLVGPQGDGPAAAGIDVRAGPFVGLASDGK